MVRGLAQHIKENDIRADISDCGLVARDIRLIRKKESGRVKHPVRADVSGVGSKSGFCSSVTNCTDKQLTARLHFRRIDGQNR
jgi:hypothetical protein